MNFEFGSARDIVCTSEMTEKLLAGGDKLTQDRDIEHAKEYWKDYQQRGPYEKRTV